MSDICPKTIFGDGPPTNFTFGNGSDYPTPAEGEVFVNNLTEDRYSYSLTLAAWVRVKASINQDESALTPQVGELVFFTTTDSCFRIGQVTATGTTNFGYSDNCA